MTTGISFHTDTITRLRAEPTVDRYGDSTQNWAVPDQLAVTGCRVIPAAGPEDVVDRDQITRRWVLFAPPTADILATDRVRWRGDDYEVTGDVRSWRSPSGRVSHLELDLTRVEG